MSSQSLRRCVLVGGVMVALLAAGCQRGEPGATKVEATNFAGWHAQATEHLTPEQGTALESAIQELKLQAMAQGASGGDGVDQAVYQKLNGKTVNEAIQTGFAAKLARLQEQREFVDRFLNQNKELKTREGDSASANYLAHRREDQTAKRDDLDRQIAEAKDQLKRLNIPVPVVQTPKPIVTGPAPVSDAAPATPATPPQTTPPPTTEQPDTAPVPVHK